MFHDPHRARLHNLVESRVSRSGDASETSVSLRRLILHRDGASLIGHVMLDLLEESGFSPDVDYQACVVTDTADIALATAVQHAAMSRGLDVDVVVVDPELSTIDGQGDSVQHAVLLSLLPTDFATQVSISAITEATGVTLVASASILGGDTEDADNGLIPAFHAL